MGAVLIGIVAGPLIAVGNNYFALWRIKRDSHPMLFITAPSYFSLVIYGAVVGLFLGIVCGYLYKHYAKKYKWAS